jgi:hypothetical protein
MSDTVDALLFDLLAWVGKRDRPYEEVMDAWRTSCPRLPIWEEANDRGFVCHSHAHDQVMIKLTPEGRAFLAGRR